MPDKIKVKKVQIGKRVNPRIVDVEIGIRSLRKIKVYPLSMHDQKELTKKIDVILKSIFSESKGAKSKEDNNLIMVSKAVKAIEDNIEPIFKFVLPDENIPKLMKELDNNQLSQIIEIVYNTNYKTPVKNVMSLFQPEQLQSVLKRQLSPSVDNTDTALNTSSKEALKKEV